MSKWKNACIGEVVDLIVSNVDKKIDPNEKQVKLCNYLDVYKNRYLDSTIEFSNGSVSDVEYEKFKLQPNDVIITKDSETPDDIAIPTLIRGHIENLVCGYHLAILRSTDKKLIAGKYLLNLIQYHYVKNQFSSVAGGATRFGLTRDAILNVKVNYPESLTVQEYVASIIESVDEVIKNNNRLLSKLKDLKKALMQELFTKGIGHKEFKDSPLGIISNAWKIVNLDSVASKITDGEHITPSRTEDGYFLLSARNIRDGFIDTNDVDYIPESEYIRLCKRIQPKENDILISCSGTIGRVAMIPKNFKCGLVRSVAIVQPRVDIIDPVFLSYMIASPIVQDQIGKSLSQLAQANLFQAQIKALKIYLPPLKEQIYIAEKIKSIDNRILSGQSKLAKIILLKKALLQDLLSGVVCVKVDIPELAGVAK